MISPAEAIPAGEGASLGEVLRRARESRGLTREAAAAQAKVPLRLAEALEEDDYSLLPDQRYLVRLVYDYAMTLGLDAGGLTASFWERVRRPSITPPAPPPRLGPIPWLKVAAVAGILAVGVPLVFIALSLIGKRTDRPPAPPPMAAPAAPAGAPERLQPEDTRPAQGVGGFSPSETAALSAPAPLPAQVATPTLPAPLPHRYQLTARAVEMTWMAIRVDGGEEREVLLRKGETVRWWGERGFLVTVGNAGGVVLALDGVELPLLGGPGEVVRDLALPGPPASSSSPGPGGFSTRR